MTAFEFHFDFGSPNAYLSHCVIPAIEQRTGVSIDYVPVLLGGLFKATNNVSPMISMNGIKNKAEYAQLETQRFISQHRIDKFNFNPFFPVNTLKIMRCAIAAEQSGVLKPYVAAVYQSMWEQPKKMDEDEMIITALNDAGLAGEQLLASASEPAIKAKLIANTEASVARGNFGSPTFYAGDEMFFGKDKLADFEAMIMKLKA